MTETEIREAILMAVINCEKVDPKDMSDRPIIREVADAREISNAVFLALSVRNAFKISTEG